METVHDVEPSRNGIPARAHNQELAALAKLREPGITRHIGERTLQRTIEIRPVPAKARFAIEIAGEAHGESDGFYKLLTRPSLTDWYEETAAGKPQRD
jgi:hypothetical protein